MKRALALERQKRWTAGATPSPAAAALQDFLHVVTIASAVELGSVGQSAAIRAPEKI